MKTITLKNTPRLASPAKKPQVYLIQQYYKPQQAQRAKEIDLCLKLNAICPVIDRIVLLTEKAWDIPVKSDKISQVVISHRLKYADVFSYILSSIPSGSIVLFGNADIFVKSDFAAIHRIDMAKTFIGLVRWDVDMRGEAKIFMDGKGQPRKDTQDLWAVRAEDVTEELVAATDFEFGKPGCDNKIAAIMNRAGFYCCNPGLDLRSYHLHNSGFRAYDENDRIFDEEYVYLEPVTI